jgi:hypothetical protein
MEKGSGNLTEHDRLVSFFAHATSTRRVALI